MSNVRTNPFREMAALQNVMDRLFYDTVQPLQERLVNEFNIAVDIYETDQGYTVLANLPGVQPENIDVRLENNLLHISVDTPEQTVHAEGTRMVVRERPTGRFSRRIQLPQHIDLERADASYDHGVLTLEIPKRPEAQPRVLTVKAGNGGTRK
jgi:HSP20 family protein